MAGRRRYTRKRKALSVSGSLRAYRKRLYMRARFVGDVLAMLQGPGSFLKRIMRKRGLRTTSSWSKKF